MTNRRGCYLRSGQDIRRWVSKLSNECYMGNLANDKLRALVQAGHLILKSLEQGDLEERVARLEEIMLNEK